MNGKGLDQNFGEKTVGLLLTNNQRNIRVNYTTPTERTKTTLDLIK